MSELLIGSVATSTELEERLLAALPTDVDHASARLVEERAERLRVRRDELDPISTELDAGVMIAVWHGGGLGYAATNDLGAAGIEGAVAAARRWAEVTAGAMVPITPPATHATGSYDSPVEITWDAMPLADRIELLRQQSRLLGVDDRIVDWSASLVRREVDQLVLTVSADGERGRIDQHFRFLYPGLRATANEGTNTQTRTFGANAFCGQGGVEVLGRYGFGDAAPRVAEQALELLGAPNCPTGVMDLLLAPDQMVLQIHESIGHPLELDRILGDERNYAGTSFVTPDMFGTFRYGSELLNVTFDPTVPGQLASYAFDDDGTPAERRHLIEDGILVRGLGGAVSQERSGLPGVANARAVSWNRPPIDRMANLNVEPGDATVDELVASVEDGVYMHTNTSWSIDDSRNKFQFGCEYGQRVIDGEIVGTVRNPGYRGISRTFWRNLKGVADRDSFTVMGTPNCGKGELNQMVGTGHAAPACLFADVEVFGGDAVSTDAQTYFDEIVGAATGRLVGDEVLLANVTGERTDFIRLNHGDVRQAGTVDQRTLGVDLVEGGRHVAGSIPLTGDRTLDDARLTALLAQLREQRRHVPEDPYLLYNTEPTSTERVEHGEMPAPDAALADIRSAAAGRDLVGIYAAGDTYSGFANSLGQRNWFQAASFNLDWCFYLHADKAAKNLYAGFTWDEEAFAAKVDWSARQLAALERDPIELAPGEYRTYLAPRAVEEVTQLLSWYGAFGRRAHETRQTPLLRMLVDDVRLSPLVTIAEDTAGGVAPNFQSAGFVRPERVPLVVEGAYRDTLVSPRSAEEYGVPTNGAGDAEQPESLSIAPGSIATDRVGEELGSGLYVGNLWYLNFSDRAACRTTGMTRFATFWMDDGEIVAPVNVLRFDDTAFHLLGDRLEGLTDTTEVLLDTSTYEQRSTASQRLPGALVSAMRFVL